VNQVNLSPPFSVKASEVQAIAGTVAAELKSVQTQPELMRKVLRQGICKALQMFGTKCAAAVTESAEAQQVTEPATQAQLQNASLHNALLQLEDEVSSVLGKYQTGNRKLASEEDLEVQETCRALKVRADDIIAPLVTSVEDHLDMILSGMHDEAFDKPLAPPSHLEVSNGVQCSPYIRQLEQAILHARRRILNKFSGFTATHGAQLGRKVLACFVRNAAFVISATKDEGKMRLATDMAQLELAMAPLCSSADLAATPEYAALRHLRPLMFATVEEIVRESSPLLPPSVIMHHLISRSAGEIPLPHRVLEWTAAEYALWLREHKEREIWESAILHGLDRYKNQIELQGEAVSEMYSMTRELGAKLIEQWERPGAHKAHS